MKLLLILTVSVVLNYQCLSQKSNTLQEKYLIVLDVQDYYTNNKMSAGSAQKLIDSVNYVIGNTNANKVIYVKSSHLLLNLSFASPFIYSSFDSIGMCMDARMQVVNENVFIKKSSNNAFSIKELNDFLTHNNAHEIVIIGLMAEQCVYKSLIEGNKLGYEMYIIPEAIVGKSQISKNTVLKKLVKKGINVINISSLQTIITD